MNQENIGWGAPRIHGELLKLGIEISQATVSKYMRPQHPEALGRILMLSESLVPFAEIV
jgi:predicted transcriptional regulator